MCIQRSYFKSLNYVIQCNSLWQTTQDCNVYWPCSSSEALSFSLTVSWSILVRSFLIIVSPETILVKFDITSAWDISPSWSLIISPPPEQQKGHQWFWQQKTVQQKKCFILLFFNFNKVFEIQHNDLWYLGKTSQYAGSITALYS